MTHLVTLECRMLDDLERGVDRSDSRLQDAMKKMRKFVRDTEGSFTPISRFAHRPLEMLMI